MVAPASYIINYAVQILWLYFFLIVSKLIIV